MQRLIPALMFLALLASCGADGTPVPPAATTPATGLSITGTASAGIARDGG